MNTYSPIRRGSVISNCTNDSDIASDKTPISGQPKKLRKQINNDEFKQNYFELSLNNTGVQVLAFQPGSEGTPKKRKRASQSNRRKSVVSSTSTCPEDSNDESSPNLQTKQTKKRKPSVAAHSVDTPSADLLFSDVNLHNIDESLLHSISCDQDLFESILQSSNMEDETPRKKVVQADDVFLPKSAFKEKQKGRNIACSTTNIQTTSSCSFNLKNSPETPNSSCRNRSTSNSHPVILNQTNSNTIRKRSNSCISINQLSNNCTLSNNNTPTNNSSNPTTVPNSTNNTLSPPERLMTKEMNLNAYLNLRREVDNCGNSQSSPMTCSTSGSTSQAMTMNSSTTDSVVSTAAISAAIAALPSSSSAASQFQQTFDSSFHFPRSNANNYCSVSNENGFNAITSWDQQQQDYNNVNTSLFSDNACKQFVNSVFANHADQQALSNGGGLDPSIFEAFFQSLETTQQPINYSSGPEISMQSLHNLEPHEIQYLIEYLERLNESKKVSPPQNSAVFLNSSFEDNNSHQLSTPSSEPFLLVQDNVSEFQASNDEFMF